MYFKQEIYDDGEYVRKDGARVMLQQCRRVRPATGWAVFETLEECLTAWHLTYAPIPEPADRLPDQAEDKQT